MKTLNGRPNEKVKCAECGYEFEDLKPEREYLCPCGRLKVYLGKGTPSWLKPKRSWLDLRILPGPYQTVLTEFLGNSPDVEETGGTS